MNILQRGIIAAGVILVTSCEDLPVASFQASPDPASVGDTIFFTNTSQSAETYHWDFNDGSSSTEEHPLHLFANSGNYQVELTASNSAGSDKCMIVVNILSPPPPGWTTLTRMLTARHAHVAVAMDNMIYVAGGITPDEQFEAYDISTALWKAKSDIPSAREFASGCVLNGKIYVIGGWWDITLDVVEVYDGKNWETKSPMLTTRFGHVAIPYDGKIYVIGGASGWPITEFYNSVEIYDPETDTWTSQSTVGTGLTPRWGHGSCLANDRLYIMGGTDAEYYTDPGKKVPALDIVEEYNPETNTWAQKASMPTARWGLTLATVNNKIYAIGGADAYDDFSESTPVVEEFDPFTNTWATKSKMPQALHLPVAVQVDDIIYITGGGGRDETDAYDTFYSYDPALDTISN